MRCIRNEGDEGMIFYHFSSSWSKDKIELNKEYNTPSNGSNYWKGKLEGSSNDKQLNNLLKSIETIFTEKYRRLIDLFNSIKPILQHEKYASELLKEYIFEEVRERVFTSLPSRKRCMFLYKPIPNFNYKEYAQNMGFDISKYNLYEIELVDNNHKIHKAEMSLLNCNLSNHDELVKRAKKYWQGTEKYGLDTEILFEGSFKINNVLIDNL